MPETYSRSADLDTPISYISGIGFIYKTYMQALKFISTVYLQLFNKKPLFTALGIKLISAAYTLVLGIRAIFVTYTKQLDIKLLFIAYTIHLAIYHIPATYTISIAYI